MEGCYSLALISVALIKVRCLLHNNPGPCQLLPAAAAGPCGYLLSCLFKEYRQSMRHTHRILDPTFFSRLYPGNSGVLVPTSLTCFLIKSYVILSTNISLSRREISGSRLRFNVLKRKTFSIVQTIK